VAGFLAMASLPVIPGLRSGVARAQREGPVVSGLVVDTVGAPVPGAQVLIEGTAHRTMTDRAGTFRLAGVDPGLATLSVRRIGFRPASLSIRVTSTGASQLMVTLAMTPEILTPVEVAAPREVFDARLDGYFERAAKRISGHIITRERIERAHSKRMVDLLRQVPSVRVTTTRNWGTVAYIRGAACTPLVFIDGLPATAGPFDLDMIDLSSVEGIEVYAGMGSVPAEFSSARGDRCGVIAIWSRPFRPRPEQSLPVVGDEAIGELLEAGQAFLPEAVDTAAVLVDGTLATVYPDSLLRERVGGTVMTRFVVDTAGAVETKTIAVSAATHRLFADAALAALRSARFSPAFRAGQRVRQVVSLPFRFSPPNPE
jgi:TonB family protein